MLRADEGGPGTSQGAGTGPAGLTGIWVSQEGVLVLAAPQRDRGRRLVLREPREAGDAHVVHRRVGAQGALLTGLVLCRHPRPRPQQRSACRKWGGRGRAGAGCGGGGGGERWGGGRRAGPELLDRREGAPQTRILEGVGV